MICERQKCTGCFACYNICPKNAIKMVKDEYGNVFPKIDETKCINCNLCKKVCPSLKEDLKLKMPKTAYAMHVKDDNKRKESSSGGAASLFYEEFLNNKGIIYGASNLFNQDEFKFIRIDNIKDLYKVKGSKYVHCYINSIYKEVKKDLDNKKDVLFIGTPCQVSGLKSFLMKEYDNLTTIDIVCHGVPSQQLFFDEIKEHNINKKDIYRVSFRDDKYFNFVIYDKKNTVLINKNSDLVDYYRNFLQGNNYRDNCYSCRYARNERISDITIGDFWGLGKDSIVYDDESKGISLILPITDKGVKLLNKVKYKCIIEERSIEEAKAKNGQLNEPVKGSKKHDIYIENYPTLGYTKTMKKMISPKDRLRIILKSNNFIYSTIKKIKKLLNH